jgi:hypothetical protein
MRSAAWISGLIALAALPAHAEVGALAASETTPSYSFATHPQSRLQAQIDALQQCGADDCVLQTVVAPGECIVFANKPDGWWTWSAGGSLEESRTAVSENCVQDQNAAKCKVQFEECLN